MTDDSMKTQSDASAPAELLSVKRMAGFWPAGAPLAVMVAGRIGPNNWWGECCVFIPKQLDVDPKAHVDLDAGINGNEYPKDVDVIDADYMRLELEQKARGFLSTYFSLIASRTGRRDLYELRYELQDGAKADIHRLITNGCFIADVQKIAQQTKHGMLRDYLSAIV